MQRSAIPYLTHSWPVVTGCSGEGCTARCWARAMARRFGRSFVPTFHPEHLADPLRARKLAVVGVAFTGDLFDPAITDEQIAAVFGVMAAAPQHTFVVLTKQAERMQAWFRWATRMDSPKDSQRRCGEASFDLCQVHAVNWAEHDKIPVGRPGHWPLPNVWLGVSISTQDEANYRIPHLLRSPADHRWVSLEPMLGPVDLPRDGMYGPWVGPNLGIDLVILGGESGPGSRLIYSSWVRSVRDQCASAGVDFAFKQGSGLHPEHWPLLDGVRHWNLPWASILETGR